ncbi:hypothetical protein AB0F81_20175 [Actinoplanes sp. NPDC024001]|uniref:hypothetical protein n=1 Tax=Actinoplanes sp. NPDC024001 TaxID=3154598 RepID=UPI0033D26BFF
MVQVSRGQSLALRLIGVPTTLGVTPPDDHTSPAREWHSPPGNGRWLPETEGFPLNDLPVRFTGVDFPTIVHARWALFFEDLRMSWQFRPTTFALGGGHVYEPDFWLPKQRTWFQVGDPDYLDDDFRQWQQFAAAADEQPCPAREQFTTGMSCPQHSSHSDPPLPEEWQARRLIFTTGGAPDPDRITPTGLQCCGRHGSLYSWWSPHFEWTACPECELVAAEENGRVDHLSCGHRSATAHRADAPQLLAAYRLARQVISAQLGGTCAHCTTPLNRGDLAGAGRAVKGRRWYHADCLLAARRRRYQLLQDRTENDDPDDSTGELLAG